MSSKCILCGKTHGENELCPNIKEELKANPSLLSEAANFTNIVAQYRLITSQDLNTAAQAVNKVLNTKLTFEGTKQFTRDIQVFKRLNVDAYSKSGVFTNAESAKDYLANATDGQIGYLKKRLTGTAQEVDWLRMKQGELSSVLEKSALLDKNAAGIDGETVSRLTGKTINKTTIKAAIGEEGITTNMNDVTEAISKGTATPNDTIVGVKGTKAAAQKAGLTNPVKELNTTETMKDSQNRLMDKIEQGKAVTSVTAQDVGKKMVQGAVVGAAVGMTISCVSNYIKYKKGLISKQEAFRDIGEDTVKSTLTGGAMAGISLFIPGGAIGFVAGMAIGVYFNAVFTNVLDEIFGKGAFMAIMDASGYVAGVSESLTDAISRIEADEQRVAESSRRIKEKKQDIDKNIGKINNLLEGI